MMTKQHLHPALGWSLSLVGLGLVIVVAMVLPMAVARFLQFQLYGAYLLVPTVLVALCTGAFAGCSRVFLYWPGGTSKYAKFLVTSPWDLRHPLLMGPFHLTLGDVAMALLVGLCCLPFTTLSPLLCMLLPVCALLLFHCLAWWWVLMIEPASKRMWGLVASSFYWLPLGLAPLLVTSHVYPAMAYVGLLIATLVGWQFTLLTLSRKVLANFPWHSPFFASTDEEDRRRSALKAVGWPHEALGPDVLRLKHGDASRLLARPLLTAALIATAFCMTGVVGIWLAFVSLSIQGQSTSFNERTLLHAGGLGEDQKLPVIVLPCLYLALLAIIYCSLRKVGTKAPRSLLLRVRLIQPISWSYSRVWIIPLAIITVVVGGAIALLLTPVPMIVTAWCGVFLLLYLLSTVGPTRETWRLTADLREVRDARPIRMERGEAQALRKMAQQNKLAAKASAAPVRPRNDLAITTALIAGCIASMELALQAMESINYAGGFTVFMRLLNATALCGGFACVMAVRRLPMLNQSYAQWLATTPWTPGRPLPMGPLRPTALDICWVAPLTLWLGYFSDWRLVALLAPAITLFAVWAFVQWLGLTAYYMDRRETPWRLYLVEVLMFSLFIAWHSAWLVLAILVLAFSLLQLDLRRAMRGFPFTSVWRQDDGDRDAPDSLVGWPWDMIAPDGQRRAARWRPWQAIAASVLVGTLAFCAGWPFWQVVETGVIRSSEGRTLAMAFVFVGTMLVGVFAWLGFATVVMGEGPSGVQTGGTRAERLLKRAQNPQFGRFVSQLNLPGRFRTGHVLSGHDTLWLLPLCSVLIVTGLAEAAITAGLPVFVFVPALIAIEWFLFGWMTHVARQWRYVTDSRFAKSTAKEQQHQQVDEPGGFRGFRGMGTKLWGSA